MALIKYFCSAKVNYKLQKGAGMFLSVDVKNLGRRGNLATHFLRLYSVPSVRADWSEALVEPSVSVWMADQFCCPSQVSR